MKTALT